MDNVNSEIIQTPPNSLEAESSVLGAMLLDRNAAVEAVMRLQADDFYYPANRAIYMALLMLYEKGMAIDAVTAVNELQASGSLELAGGINYIVELTENVPGVSNIDDYIKLVEEKSTLRKLGNIGDEIRRRSSSVTEQSESIIEYAEKSIFDISLRDSIGGLVPVRTTLQSVYSAIEEASRQKSPITGLSTGFYDLDDLTSGLQNSDLILVAARPSMGKTSFLMNIVDNVSRVQHIPTAVFSVEMSREQLIHRQLCMIAAVDQKRAREGRINDDEWERLTEALAVLSVSPLYVDDTGGITPNEIRSKLRRMKIERGVGFAVIDYLQLMQGSVNRQNSNRQQEISDISRALKMIAREMNIPLLVAAQLSRAPELRANNHRPILSDLRDSGAIEQDADVVMMLYREEYYNPEAIEERGITEVIITKQRNGPTDTVKLQWNGSLTRYMNSTRRQ